MAATAWNAAPARALDLLGDERLARLAARGDQRAFAALFGRYLPGLTRYCGGILRHSADAEDAAQNAMVAALKALEGGTVPMRVKPWLYRIAHNEAMSLVRRRRPAEELDEAALPGVGDAEELRATRERLGQLLADLRSLTERQRQALVLRELYDFSYIEIAQTLRSSEGAAQQTVFEARSALRQFGEGRGLDCAGVQRAMSDCDGMRLRTLKVRAHVRGCACCSSFERSLLARRRDLGLLFPPTGAAGGLLAALARLVGVGGGGGEPLVAGLGLKGVAVGLAVLAGGGAVVATSVSGPPRALAPVTAPSMVAAQDSASSGPSSAGGTAAGARSDVARAGTGQGGKTKGKHSATGSTQPVAAPTGAGVVGASSAGDAASAGGGVGRLPSGSGGTGSGSSTGSGAGPAGGVVDTSTLPVHPSAPSPIGQAVDSAGDAVSGTTQAATQAVQQTAQQVTQTATDAAGAVTDAAQAVTGATDTATAALPKLP